MRHQGFVLIELMTVVSIIAILALMSLPSYGHYMERAKISEAFSLTQNVTRMITEYYAYYGKFPLNNQDLVLPAPEALYGHYVKSIQVKNGTIYVTFSDPTLAGILTLRPAILTADLPVYSLIWVCGHAQAPAGTHFMDEDNTTIPYKSLPLLCV